MKLLAVIASLVVLSPLTVFAAGVTVTFPAGGDCLQAGTLQDVTWTSSGNDHFALYYRTDGSTPGYGTLNYLPALAHKAYGLSWSWLTPSVTTDLARIWVEGHNSADDSFVIDNSDSNFSIDNSPPSAPTISASEVTATTVSLAWSSVSDSGCKGLAGYRIYRDTKLIKTVGAGATSYQDTGLDSDHAYYYKVVAYDDFHSTESNSIFALTEISDKATPTPKPQSDPVATEEPLLYQSDAVRYPSSAVAPVLDGLTVDGRKLAVIKDKALIISQGQKLSLSGTTSPNAKVTVSIYSQVVNHEVTANSNGRWNFDVNTRELETGEHHIEVAAQAESGMGEPNDVLHFTLVPLIQADQARQQQRALAAQNLSNMWYFLAAVAAGGLTAWILIMLSRRTHRIEVKQVAKT